MRHKISPIDIERFRYINNLMDGLHLKLSDVYEALADREIIDAKKNIDVLIKELREIQSTM